MHKVKCKYCEIIFDADQEPYVYIESSRRYAHKNCYENFTSQLTQNEKDYLELEKYIKKLFGKDYVNAKIMNQIQSYRQTYGYTYLRIFVQFILITEILISIPIMIKLLGAKIDLVKTSIVITCFMYLILNFMNIIILLFCLIII